MDTGVELIIDDGGMAVLGDAGSVTRFLAAEGLEAVALDAPSLREALTVGSTAAQGGSVIAANTGRWVKLTKESAQLAQKYGLRESSKGLSTGVVHGGTGKIKGFVEFAKVPGAALTSPAALAGVGGVMAQLAMQQAMKEITDYLAAIDSKLDDILRGQKDAVFADLIGVGMVIDDAMTVREEVGSVSEVTWSKVQGTSATIARTQAQAMLKIRTLAEGLEGAKDMGDLATAAREAEGSAQEWVAVLARCSQLQDAIAVLELDRVLGTSPDEIERHRVGVRAARRKRLEFIATKTQEFLNRLDRAAQRANDRVLLHPVKAGVIARSSGEARSAVAEFGGYLGLDIEQEAVQHRRWRDAAVETRDQVIESGTERAEAARTLSQQAVRRTRAASRSAAADVAGRARRLRRGGDKRD